MEESLTAHLLANSGLAAVVADRVFWGVRPQSTPLPAIAMFVVSSIPADSDDITHDETETRVQFDCLGKLSEDAVTVARALKSALLGAPFTVDGFEFQGAFLETERSDHTQSTAGESVHRRSVDFLIWHA
jgi:hypothetical protein